MGHVFDGLQQLSRPHRGAQMAARDADTPAVRVLAWRADNTCSGAAPATHGRLP